MVNPLDAGTEFQDGVGEAEAAKAAAEKAEADKAAAEKDKADLANKVSGLETTLTEKLKVIDTLTSKTQILDKLQEVLGAKPVDKQDEFVTSEIRRRLGGDLEDVNKIKQIIPVLLEMVGTVAEDRMTERIDSAQDVLSSEMTKLGLDPSDKETFQALEEAVTSVIRADEELGDAWNKGQIKKAVSKAFDRLQTKLYAPVRSKMKRSAVNQLLDGPKPSPKGGAPSSSPASKGTNVVDVRDTSRAGIGKVHDAAFERLQELLDSE
jgi:hypothetical protein